MADEETTYEASFDDDTDYGSREFPTADWGGGSHTVVTEKNWFQRLFDSFVGLLAGIIMFVGSFGLLYWNEGRLDMSTVVKKAVEMQAASPNMGAQGKLIAATGTLTAGPALGDNYVAPGPFAALRREVEMYAWEEESHSKTEKKAGGGERTVTTYTYSRRWTSSPDTSFKNRNYHNPTMAERSTTLKAQNGRVGVIPLDMAQVDLPAPQPLSLSSGTTRNGRLAGGKLYIRNADPSYPKVGDIRMTYSAVRTGGNVTLVGQMGPGKQVQRYTHNSGDTVYRVFTGSKKDAVKQLHGEFVMMTWILRGVGFLLMWFGMRLFLEPLNTVLDVLPFLGDLGRGLTGFATFIVAAVLSLITIIVAQILHNLIAMLVIGAVVVVGSVLIFGKKQGMTRKVRRA